MTITTYWDGTALPVDEQAQVEVVREGEQVVIRGTAMLPFGVHAPESEAGFTDGLWEYDVVECFAVAPDGTYVEIELGPKKHWLAYWFSSYRTRVDRAFESSAFVYTKCVQDGKAWEFECRFPLTWLPAAWESLRWNTYQIRRRGDAGEYDFLAWKSDASVAPDFHLTAPFASLPNER